MGCLHAGSAQAMGRAGAHEKKKKKTEVAAASPAGQPPVAAARPLAPLVLTPARRPPAAGGRRRRVVRLASERASVLAWEEGNLAKPAKMVRGGRGGTSTAAKGGKVRSKAVKKAKARAGKRLGAKTHGAVTKAAKKKLARKKKSNAGPATDPQDRCKQDKQDKRAAAAKVRPRSRRRCEWDASLRTSSPARTTFDTSAPLAPAHAHMQALPSGGSAKGKLPTDASDIMPMQG